MLCFDEQCTISSIDLDQNVQFWLKQRVAATCVDHFKKEALLWRLHGKRLRLDQSKYLGYKLIHIYTLLQGYRQHHSRGNPILHHNITVSQMKGWVFENDGGWVVLKTFLVCPKDLKNGLPVFGMPCRGAPRGGFWKHVPGFNGALQSPFLTVYSSFPVIHKVGNFVLLPSEG